MDHWKYRHKHRERDIHLEYNVRAQKTTRDKHQTRMYILAYVHTLRTRGIQRHGVALFPTIYRVRSTQNPVGSHCHCDEARFETRQRERLVGERFRCHTWRGRDPLARDVRSSPSTSATAVSTATKGTVFESLA